MGKDLEVKLMAEGTKEGMQIFFNQTIDNSVFEMIDKNIIGEWKESLDIKNTDNVEKSLSTLGIVNMILLSKMLLKKDRLTKKDIEQMISTNNYITTKLKEIKEKYYGGKDE